MEETHNEMLEKVIKRLEEMGYNKNQIIRGGEEKNIHFYTKRRENVGVELLNPDLVVIDKNNGIIRLIVEVESGSRPPKILLGTIITADCCEICYIGKIENGNIYDNNQSSLYIILNNEKKFGKDKRKQINWINKEFRYKYNFKRLKKYKICSLTEFMRKNML